MTAPSRSRWAGIPAGERQSERRALLVAAAFELLGTVGTSGTTVRGVCEAARLNPRYFYESFDDIDALLVAVFDHVAEDALAVMVRTVAEAPTDPLAQSRAGIGSFIRHVTDDPRRAQVLFIEGVGNEAMSRRRLTSMHELAALLEQGGPDGGAPAIDPIVSIAANLLVGGMAELMIAWLHGKLDVSLDQLVDDTALLFVATGEAAANIAAARTEDHGRPAPSRARGRNP